MKVPPQHILAIRFSAMGDVAMTVPVLHDLLSKHPDLKITVVTRQGFAPIFRDLPRIMVFSADLQGKHKGIRGIHRLAGELKELAPDAVADLHDVLRSVLLRTFLRFSNIPVKVIDKGRKEKASLVRTKKKEFRQLKTTPARYADVFSSLGYTVDLERAMALPKRPLSKKIWKITGRKKTLWLGIAPFAQHGSKTYPRDLMEVVIRELAGRKDLRVFLFGGGRAEVSALNAWGKEISGCTSVAGKFTFCQELDLISNLDGMLSMDSANAHLAANFGVPVIVLWGNTHPYAGFAPFHQPERNFILPDRKKYPLLPTSVYGRKSPEDYQDVMRSISPGLVVDRVEEVLCL